MIHLEEVIVAQLGNKFALLWNLKTISISSFPSAPNLPWYSLLHKFVIVHMKLTDVSEACSEDSDDGGS
jgi:hypothetical protein